MFFFSVFLFSFLFFCYFPLCSLFFFSTLCSCSCFLPYVLALFLLFFSLMFLFLSFFSPYFLVLVLFPQVHVQIPKGRHKPQATGDGGPGVREGVPVPLQSTRTLPGAWEEVVSQPAPHPLQPQVHAAPDPP